MFSYRIKVVIAFVLWSAMSAAHSETLSIAMVLWRSETVAEHHFKDELSRLGYNVKYKEINAEQDKKTLVLSVYEELMPELDNYDYVYTFGTTVSMLVKNLLRGQKPQLFNIVVAPVETKLVDTLQKTGGNISGASPAVPLELQFKNVCQLFDFKKLGMFFNPRERNSMIMRDKLKKLGVKYGFQVIDLSLPPANKQRLLRKYTQALRTGEMELDAVYLPMDTYISTQAGEIAKAMHDLQIKTIGANPLQLNQGVLMGTVADYAEMGRAAAHIIHKHQQGQALEDIPVSLPQQPRFIINQSVANLLNVSVPPSLQQHVEFKK